MALRRIAKRLIGSRRTSGGRIYAIGDVHGRLDLFRELCALVSDDMTTRARPSSTRMILLGDVIDRGPDSRGMVELGMRLTSEARFVILKGNHEAALVDAWRGDHDALELWIQHGGRATLASYGVDVAAIDADDWLGWMRATRDAIPTKTIAWLDRLPTWIESDGHYFVHAGVRPGLPLAAQSDHDRLWIRDEFLDSVDDHGAIIVHGHVIEDEVVRIRPNRIGVDTGAYRTGRLSAVAIEDGEHWVIATGPSPATDRQPSSINTLRGS